MNIGKYIKNHDEKPLDNIVSDGGFCSIFRTIGCVGDSLSSGEFESLNESLLFLRFVSSESLSRRATV